MSSQPVADRMTQLSRRVREVTPGADVRVLSGDQLLVSLNLIPNPAMEREGKAATYTPGDDGYQVHVACRPAAEHDVQAALSQRMTGPGALPVVWDSRSMQLRVNDLTRRWLVSNELGEIVTVEVAAGSVQVLDEVNAVLTEVQGVLLT